MSLILLAISCSIYHGIQIQQSPSTHQRSCRACDPLRCETKVLRRCEDDAQLPELTAFWLYPRKQHNGELTALHRYNCNIEFIAAASIPRHHRSYFGSLNHHISFCRNLHGTVLCHIVQTLLEFTCLLAQHDASSHYRDPSASSAMCCNTIKLSLERYITYHQASITTVAELGPPPPPCCLQRRGVLGSMRLMQLQQGLSRKLTTSTLAMAKQQRGGKKKEDDGEAWAWGPATDLTSLSCALA